MLKRIAVGAAAGAMLVGSTAHATENDGIDGFFENIPGKFSANVAIASDYVFRGISQTGAAPALQGGFDWAHSIATDELPLNLSLGVWGSNVDFADGDNASVELDYRSEEHTSELQSLMRISYAVFCLKKKTKKKQQ